jgi:hypothetical protein
MLKEPRIKKGDLVCYKHKPDYWGIVVDIIPEEGFGTVLILWNDKTYAPYDQRRMWSVTENQLEVVSEGR